MKLGARSSPAPPPPPPTLEVAVAEVSHCSSITCITYSMAGLREANYMMVI